MAGTADVDLRLGILGCSFHWKVTVVMNAQEFFRKRVEECRQMRNEPLEDWSFLEAVAGRCEEQIWQLKMRAPKQPSKHAYTPVLTGQNRRAVG
jgi:hypothetical protein